jgi:hypothetical protein
VTRRWAFATIGLAAGFSGLAIITTILTGIPLWLVESATVLVPLTFVTVVIRRTPRPIVLEIWRVVRTGLVAGFAASIVYDATRISLSIFDPSPYNPFEAIRQFGLGMLGADAALPLVFSAGFVIHFLNGTTFGVIYAIFAGRHVRTVRGAVLSGVAWGLTLELIQSILYPGWLKIPNVVLDEFLIISGLGHVMYGATLGFGVRRLLFRRSTVEVRHG